ncbi:MAG: LysM peptidoglycan-binding domain-containing protein [Spirochaetes bacterium]|nr:LysM peptidoglycan-binding domain-containing protein [Spirochaetota bacterium]
MTRIRLLPSLLLVSLLLSSYAIPLFAAGASSSQTAEQAAASTIETDTGPSTDAPAEQLPPAVQLEPPSPRPLRQPATDTPPSALSIAPVRHSRGIFTLPDDDIQTARFVSLYQSPGGQAWLRRVFERALPYSAYILDRIHHYAVPEELFFLPFIESEFLVKAVSRSGATGLWQFMRNSIGGYNMHIDEWRDDRRDFMKATEAALLKLQWNYQYFGDWLLALAAYNCGVGALDRAIVRADGERDFWKLRAAGVLPAETATYIPKFLAVAAVGMQAGRLNLAPPAGIALQWAKLPLDSPVDIQLLAEHIKLPLDTIKAGNPELNYNITPPDGVYELKLPQEYIAPARLALAGSQNLIKVYVHTVGSGDTVSAIARHYEVGIDMIVRMNSGLNPDRIRIGQKLVIPALKEKVPYAGVERAGADHDFEGSYIVQAGDTLWNIARSFDVAVELLAAKNSLKLDSILREGMSLNVPIMNQ